MKDINTKIEEKLDRFVNTLIETNRGYDFFVDWNKTGSVDDCRIELCAMDVLVGNSDFDNTFRSLLEKMPSVIRTFPLLLALAQSERENYVKGKKHLTIVDIEQDAVTTFTYSFKERILSDKDIDDYLQYFNKTGLKEFFMNTLEKSVTDYAVGVLVGLDSNGRKQRSGKAFEQMCTPVIQSIADKYGFECHKQARFSTLKERGIEITNDISERIADFLLIKDGLIVNIEVNFFNGGGSKPEEIISSYIHRQKELKENGIDFVFITDGANCWKHKEKSQLVKAFHSIDNIMNLQMAKEGFLEDVIRNLANNS